MVQLGEEGSSGARERAKVPGYWAYAREQSRRDKTICFMKFRGEGELMSQKYSLIHIGV